MQAIIHPITPFDATIGTQIGITWNGNQIYKLRLVVKNNETLATVYDQTIDTMKSTYTVPIDSCLVNGTYYVAYITVFDVDGNESDMQAIGTPFYCFATPLFCTSISNSDTIRTSSYNVSLSYSQENNEELDWCNITLYSYSKTELQSSGNIYTSDTNFTISGLENMNQYYIRAIGETVHGITLDTGYILFIVKYEQYKIFSNLELYNYKNTGRIGISTNLISAEATPDSPVVYIDDTYVDLTDNKIEFSTGFEVQGDFANMFVMYNLALNKPFVVLSDNQNKTKIELYYREGSYADSDGKKAFIEMRATSVIDTCVLMSNYVDIPTENQVMITVLRRKGSLFALETKLIEKGS